MNSSRFTNLHKCPELNLNPHSLILNPQTFICKYYYKTIGHETANATREMNSRMICVVQYAD